MKTSWDDMTEVLRKTRHFQKNWYITRRTCTFYILSLSLQRDLTEAKRESLTAEFENLNLTKYIQEAVSHVTLSHTLLLS